MVMSVDESSTAMKQETVRTLLRLRVGFIMQKCAVEVRIITKAANNLRAYISEFTSLGPFSSTVQ